MPDSSNTFLDPIADDMLAVDQIIRRQLHSDVELIRRVGEYIVGAGGKRIRPALVLLFAHVCGYRGTNHHTLAAIIEFIHTSTLLHDDVVDESDLRRGQKTANALFGNAASVLVGDFLYSRTFQMMVSVPDLRIMRLLADATNVLAEGEAKQLMNARDPAISVERYMDVIDAKTAKLFEVAAVMGAMAASASESDIAAAAAYGRALGIAFQLVDDVLDYTGNVGETGKNVGDDLREGKMTLPLIYLMQHGTEDQKRLARDCVMNADDSHFDTILAAVADCGGLEYAKHKAREAAAAAADAIRHLPSSQFKDSLLQLCAFAVERNH